LRADPAPNAGCETVELECPVGPGHGPLAVPVEMEQELPQPQRRMRVIVDAAGRRHPDAGSGRAGRIDHPASDVLAAVDRGRLLDVPLTVDRNLFAWRSRGVQGGVHAVEDLDVVRSALERTQPKPAVSERDALHQPGAV